jgi:hypothetical protein
MKLRCAQWITLGLICSLCFAIPAGFEQASGVAGSATAQRQLTRSVGLIDMHLVGAATFTPKGRVRLVHAGKSDTAGAAYTPDPVDVTSFTVKMVFHIVGGCSDGLALLIQNEGPDALGATGGDLGYGRETTGFRQPIPGITHSIAVELDTWQNAWDPAVPHVSLQSRGVRENDTNTKYSLSNKGVGPVNDGQRHRLTIHYRDGIVHVWYGDQRLINNHLDLAHHLGLSDGTAFVGVTAGNGACASATTLDDFHYFASAA